MAQKKIFNFSFQNFKIFKICVSKNELNLLILFQIDGEHQRKGSHLERERKSFHRIGHKTPRKIARLPRSC